MNRTVLVGVGKGGRALLSLLLEDPEVQVLGVAARTEDSPGLAFAREQGVFGTSDISELLTLPSIDVIIDASGSDEIAQLLAEKKPPRAEVISGLSLNFMWNLVEERMRREQDHRALYRIGLLLTTVNSEQEVLEAILRSATDIIRAPAASVALYDKEKKELCLTCSRGFSKEFEAASCWPVRRGGLSSRILKAEHPVIFEDVLTVPELATEIMVREGVRAVAAVPLKTRGRTIGVLYVDDFKPRRFNGREIALLELLANQAALAIDKAQLIEDKVRLATTDGLTGIYNRRHFQEMLKAEVDRSSRYGQTFCLAILDLDFFKTINDRMGHTKGDEVLKAVADVVRANLRSSDFLARYGGEEFVVILPHTSLAESHHAAEKIRKAVSELKIRGIRGEYLRLTTSIGVADYPASGSTADELINAADSALLMAKRSGRNRVCYFPDVDVTDHGEADSGIASRLRGHDFLTLGALIAALQDAESANKSQALTAAEYYSKALSLSREEREALLLGVQIHRKGHPARDHDKEQDGATAASKVAPPGGLTGTEWSVIKKHANSVVRVVRALRGVNMLASTILHHHEKWDGSGYPDGLQREQIPLLARVLSVCEAYQELVDPKPHGAGLTAGEALARLRSKAGGELDPVLVDLLCRAGEARQTGAEDVKPVDQAAGPAIPPITDAQKMMSNQPTTADGGTETSEK